MTQPSTSPRTFPALCGLAGVLAFAVFPMPDWIVHGNSMGQLLAGEAVYWGFTAIVLLWLRYAEGLPFSSIGFRALTWKGIVIGIAGAIVLTAIQIVQFAVIVPLFHLDTTAILARRDAIMNTPYWYRILLVLRAAFTEEVIYRGYLIEKVRQLSGSTTAAVILSVAAFTYSHLGGWGPVHLIAVSAGGLVFALLYIWKKDLPSNMIAHFLSDAAGFLTS
ncbi:MAG TPA: CPBP family intramembrane glutamic endopeptidase [Bryobacteraceae bacterium]|jgi:membrane protease YdiL (CAAX protease family)|nr:CPBP family intramembrane glutamic endopeptidase [Bryobacteraceae bacterium]